MTKNDKREAIDTGRIMAGIEARIAERKRAGEYSDQEIDEISAMELMIREGSGYGEDADRLLSWLHAHWESTGPVDPERAAPSGVGREGAKRFARFILKPLSRLLLAKQNQINAKSVQLLSSALPPLRDGYREVEDRLDSIARRMEEEQGRLRKTVEDLEVRLRRLESGAGPTSGGETEKR